jgi:hypothetical protein
MMFIIKATLQGNPALKYFMTIGNHEQVTLK